jgi:succinate dehydrogenase / fumarate reductase iron-sulfur subunit
MNINGVNGLACITSTDDLKQPIEINPLPGLPVIRDLIIDMDQFYKQYRAVKPYLIVNDPMPDVELKQTPQQREQLDGLYECVLCACCSTACPSFWWNPDKFWGQQHCYRHHASSKIVVIRPLKNGWKISKGHSSYFAAIPS